MTLLQWMSIMGHPPPCHCCKHIVQSNSELKHLTNHIQVFLIRFCIVRCHHLTHIISDYIIHANTTRRPTIISTLEQACLHCSPGCKEVNTPNNPVIERQCRRQQHGSAVWYCRQPNVFVVCVCPPGTTHTHTQGQHVPKCYWPPQGLSGRIWALCLSVTSNCSFPTQHHLKHMQPEYPTQFKQTTNRIVFP